MRKRTIRDDDEVDDDDAPTTKTAIPRRSRPPRSSPNLLDAMTQPPEQPSQGLSTIKPIPPNKNVTPTPIMINSTTTTSTTHSNSNRRREAQQPQQQMLLQQPQPQQIQVQLLQQPIREVQLLQPLQQPPTVMGMMEQKVMTSLQTLCENVATLHPLSNNEMTFVDLSGSFLPPMDFILDQDELNMSTKIPMFPEDFPPNQPPWPLSWWGIVDPELISDPTIVDARLFQTSSNSRGSGRRGDDPQMKTGDYNRRGQRERP